MTTRSTLWRGAAALALAVGLVATTTSSPAYAKPANPEGSQPSLPAGLPGIPGLTGSGGGKMSPQDWASTIAGGLRLAADATEVVVPLVVEAVDP